jgi:hypothetical protein
LGGLKFKASPGKDLKDPISKITRAKWTGGVAQVVQHLLCKYKILSSNPSLPATRPPQKKRNPTKIILKILILSGIFGIESI